MPSPKNPKHVVVDGSNIATEGRSAPSLKQLNEAVLAFMNEFPDTKVTVVVDASFGHRIDKKEVAEFDEAVDNNELVTPPAGAIGRGDAFVLAIADKVIDNAGSLDDLRAQVDEVWVWAVALPPAAPDAGRQVPREDAPGADPAPGT